MKAITYTKIAKVEIDVRRPNGEVETMDVTAKFFNGLTDKLFQAAKKQTAAAGRGELLAYRNLTEVAYHTKTEVDLVCDHQDRMAHIMATQG